MGINPLAEGLASLSSPPIGQSVRAIAGDYLSAYANIFTSHTPLRTVDVLNGYGHFPQGVVCPFFILHIQGDFCIFAMAVCLLFFASNLARIS
jgi:hypothetical protein